MCLGHSIAAIPERGRSSERGVGGRGAGAAGGAVAARGGAGDGADGRRAPHPAAAAGAARARAAAAQGLALGATDERCTGLDLTSLLILCFFFTNIFCILVKNWLHFTRYNNFIIHHNKTK